MPRNEICLVSGIYPPESGGPAKFTFEFSQWLNSRGTSSSTVTLTDGPSEVRQENLMYILKISRSIKLPLRYLRVARAIRRSSARGVPILAAGMFIETFLATRFSRRSYIAKVPGDFVWERARNNGYTDLDIETFQKTKLNLKYRAFRSIASLSLKKAAIVIVPTKQLERLSLAWGVAPERIRYIPNSVETSVFKPGHANIIFDVVTVCRLVKWKGLSELVSASKQLGLSVAIAGDGPERTALELQAAELGASVTFLGQMDPSDLVSLYQQSRFFVLNSSYEGLSHALLEARASGLFCIARANTGSEDVIVHKKDGLLCGGSDFPTLASALEFAMAHKEFVRDCISSSLMRTHEVFDRDRNFNTIAELCQEITL